MRALVLTLVLLAPGLAGCLYDEPGPAQVEGRVTGYSPTQAYLKLEVQGEDGRVVSVDFDRRDWHVRELARQVDLREVRVVTIDGMERNIPGAVLAEQFVDPDQLNELRYETMGASAQQRALLDAEYEAWLAELTSNASDSSPPRIALPAQPM